MQCYCSSILYCTVHIEIWALLAPSLVPSPSCVLRYREYRLQDAQRKLSSWRPRAMFLMQARSLCGLSSLSYRLGHTKLLARLRRSSRTSRHFGGYLAPGKLWLEHGRAGRAPGCTSFTSSLVERAGRRAVLLRWDYLSQAGWTHTGPDTIGALNAATGLRPACISTILDEPHRGAAGDSASPASSATSSYVKTTLFPPPHREVLMRALLARGGHGGGRPSWRGGSSGYYHASGCLLELRARPIVRTELRARCRLILEKIECPAACHWLAGAIIY